VASELRDWLQLVINDVEPFISSDIDAGARWQSEIAAELETTEFGILCVTADNQRTAWLNFEGGALAKTVNTSRVVPLAIDLSPAEIQTPLGQFQAQPLSRAGIEKIVASINVCLPKPLPINLIEKQIGKWWPDLEQKINEIDQELSLSLGSERPARTDRELLEDILNTVRSLSRISERSGIGRVGLEGLYNALKGDTSADFLESILRRNPEWPDKTLTSLMRDLRALFRTRPAESVKFECGDRGKAGSEFSQRSTVPGGQNLPVLEVGDAAFDRGADTGEVFVCVDLSW
jgi:hypothetical protein